MRAVSPKSPAVTPPSPSPVWLRPWFFPLLIILAVVGVYGNTLRVPFVFDDAGAVVNNTSIRQLWPLKVPLTPPSDGSTATGRPVLNFTYALNYALSGLDGWSYHATNILLHTLAALTLLGLVHRTLRQAKCHVIRDTSPGAGWLAGWIALLWAVHPLLTETVSSIAQRTEGLVGFFYLFTLYAFSRAADSARPGRWFFLSVVACLLGMGSKEVMVTAPLVVLLYDRTFVAGSFAEAWRRHRRYYASLAATWLLLAWILLGAGGSRGTSAGFGFGMTPWTYLLTQCEALIIYLKLCFWPHPLVLDYGMPVVTSASEVVLQGLGLLALLAGTVWALVRRPVLGFAGAWFFLILAPSSSVVPLVAQTMAEHRMYLPLLSVLALAMAALYRWLGARAGWVLGAWIVVLAGLSVARNHDYRSALVLWTDTVEKRPHSERAHTNLGLELQRAGRIDEAVASYRRALVLKPAHVSAHYQLGLLWLEQGRVDDALVSLQTAVRLAPGHADAQLALGNALVRAGRADEAIEAFRASLRVVPAADAYFNLGVAQENAGREAGAIAAYEAALQVQPGLAAAQERLARLHVAAGVRAARAGDAARAIPQLEAAVRLRPASVEAQANLGNAYFMQGRVADAIACYEAVLRLRPGDRGVRENLELARETLRQGK